MILRFCCLLGANTKLQESMAFSLAWLRGRNSDSAQMPFRDKKKSAVLKKKGPVGFREKHRCLLTPGQLLTSTTNIVTRPHPSTTPKQLAQALLIQAGLSLRGFTRLRQNDPSKSLDCKGLRLKRKGISSQNCTLGPGVRPRFMSSRRRSGSSDSLIHLKHPLEC